MSDENTKEEVKKEEGKPVDKSETEAKVESTPEENLEVSKKDKSEEVKEAADTKEDKTEAKVESTPEKKADKKPQKKKTVKASEVEEKKVQAPAYLADLNFFPEIRTDIPQIKSGDIINLSYRIVEGGKEKTQNYKGTVIALKGTGISRTITVRKMSFGIAVERIFPLNSKFVKEITIDRRSKVRRAKLYYLRNLRGKASRLKPLR